MTPVPALLSSPLSASFLPSEASLNTNIKAILTFADKPEVLATYCDIVEASSQSSIVFLLSNPSEEQDFCAPMYLRFVSPPGLEETDPFNVSSPLKWLLEFHPCFCLYSSLCCISGFPRGMPRSCLSAFPHL